VGLWGFARHKRLGNKKVGWESDWIRQPEKGGAASVGVAWLAMLF
jgi:hypothetical protein